jgi:hypothetical protein
MDIESEIDGWKIVLNITEFILHANLRDYLNEFRKVILISSVLEPMG